MVCSGGGENVRSVEKLKGAQLVDPRRLHTSEQSFGLVTSRSLLAVLTAVLLAPRRQQAMEPEARRVAPDVHAGVLHRVVSRPPSPTAPLNH